MKIQKINSNSQKTSFKSLSCQNGKHVLDTAFFRGMKTMNEAVKLTINANPKGSCSVHCGGSVGQEAFTEGMLINNPNHKIFSLDIDTYIFDLIKKNMHSVFNSWSDDFLLSKYEDLNEEKQLYKKLFEKYFDRIFAPDKPINGSNYYKEISKRPGFEERYYEANKEGLKLVEFSPPDESNILDIYKFKPEAKIKTIYARNVFFNLSGNNSIDVIWNGAPKREVNMEPLEEAASKLHSRLEDNGYLVLGNSAKEHLYIAEEGFCGPVQKLSELRYYQKLNDQQKLLTKDIAFYRTNPLRKILTKNFKPVFWDKIDESPDISVPTIWQKI